VAPQVAGLTERWPHHTEREHWAGDGPCHHGSGAVELDRDLFQRDHQQRDGEADGEQARQHHPQHCPAMVDAHASGDATTQQDGPRNDGQLVDAAAVE
jgi:hypothetical protein